MDGPYQDHQIANMDEVPLWIDMTPDHTLDFQGVKEVSLKCTNKYKMRATLVLGVFASGEKLTPMLIFKEASRELPKKLKDAYDDQRIIIRANKKGWMNEKLFKEWVEKAWKSATKTDESYVLIWDSFAPHKSKEIIDNLAEELDTEVCIIPGGCTSVLQPLDVGVNKPMKDRL